MGGVNELGKATITAAYKAQASEARALIRSAKEIAPEIEKGAYKLYYAGDEGVRVGAAVNAEHAVNPADLHTIDVSKLLVGNEKGAYEKLHPNELEAVNALRTALSEGPGTANSYFEKSLTDKLAQAQADAAAAVSTRAHAAAGKGVFAVNSAGEAGTQLTMAKDAVQSLTQGATEARALATTAKGDLDKVRAELDAAIATLKNERSNKSINAKGAGNDDLKAAEKAVKDLEAKQKTAHLNWVGLDSGAKKLETARDEATGFLDRLENTSVAVDSQGVATVTENFAKNGPEFQGVTKEQFKLAKPGNRVTINSDPSWEFFGKTGTVLDRTSTYATLQLDDGTRVLCRLQSLKAAEAPAAGDAAAPATETAAASGSKLKRNLIIGGVATAGTAGVVAGGVALSNNGEDHKLDGVTSDSPPQPDLGWETN